MAEALLTVSTWLVLIVWPISLVALVSLALMRRRKVNATIIPDADNQFASARAEYEGQLARVAIRLSACREQITAHVDPVRRRIQILEDLREAFSLAESEALQEVSLRATESSSHNYLSAILAMKNAQSFRSMLEVAESLIEAEQRLLKQLDGELGDSQK